MKLDVSQWQEFVVGSIFEIRNGRGITAEEVSENPGNLNAVQSGAENNGIMGCISVDYCHEMNYVFTLDMCLTVARTGSAGFVSFQPDGCVVGDSAKLLIPRYKDATPEVYLFLQAVLNQNRFKYSYGRKVTESKYLADVVDLPIQRDEDGNPIIDDAKTYNPDGHVPDWQFMEDFVRSLHHKPITTKNSSKSAQPLDIDEFAHFTFGNLVSEIYKAKAHTKDDLTEVEPSALEVVETIRYITRTAENNGCELLAVRTNELESGIEKGNAITIGDTTATCFYQGEDFVAGDHIVVIRADWLNPFAGNFITTLLNRESYRYSYGRAFIMNSIRETSLKLPIRHDEVGNPIIDPTKQYHEQGYIPDWQFMEEYVCSLPYGDRIPKLPSSRN